MNLNLVGGLTRCIDWLRLRVAWRSEAFYPHWEYSHAAKPSQRFWFWNGETSLGQPELSPAQWRMVAEGATSRIPKPSNSFMLRSFDRSNGMEAARRYLGEDKNWLKEITGSLPGIIPAQPIATKALGGAVGAAVSGLPAGASLMVRQCQPLQPNVPCPVCGVTEVVYPAPSPPPAVSHSEPYSTSRGPDGVYVGIVEEVLRSDGSTCFVRATQKPSPGADNPGKCGG